MPDLSTITPVTREEEFLDRIARAAASPNLPEVDTSDNGDVLTVVSGEWAAAAPAGGSALSVTVSEVTTEGGSYWQMDKTYSQILSAFSAGTPVVVHFFDNEYESDMYGIVTATQTGTTYYYVYCWYNGDKLQFYAEIEGADLRPIYVWD